MFGVIGHVQAVEVSFDEEPAKMLQASVSSFDRKINSITWRIQGSIDQVDHFLIFKESNNVRTLIGKAHSEFNHGSCQYLHALGKRDTGAFSYVVIPIFNDYRVGTETKTNSIVIEGHSL